MDKYSKEVSCGLDFKAKFSIIIPIYNVEPYLRCALDSIKNQTLQDFEVICVDDGSVDNSLDILREYAKNDARFKVISQSNAGQGIARNRAIDISQGEYILFLDPDDYIESNTLELLYTTFKKTKAPVIQFDYKLFEDGTNKTKLRTFKRQAKKRLKYNIPQDSFFNWKNLRTRTMLTEMSQAAWVKAYSSDFIKNNNIKFAPNKHGEDHIFSISTLLLADKIYYLQEPLYYYRERANSAVNKLSDDNFCIFENIEILRKFLQEHKLYEILKAEFEQYVKNVLKVHYNCILPSSRQKYLDECSKLFTPEENKTFLEELGQVDKSFIEKIFSIKNKKENGEKSKLITIFGLAFDIKIKSNS